MSHCNQIISCLTPPGQLFAGSVFRGVVGVHVLGGSLAVGNNAQLGNTCSAETCKDCSSSLNVAWSTVLWEQRATELPRVAAAKGQKPTWVVGNVLGPPQLA